MPDIEEFYENVSCIPNVMALTLYFVRHYHLLYENLTLNNSVATKYDNLERGNFTLLKAEISLNPSGRCYKFFQHA
jgi:hypothetical protein